MLNIRLATPSDRNETLRLVSALLSELGGTPPPAEAMAPVFDNLVSGGDTGFIVLGEITGANEIRSVAEMDGDTGSQAIGEVDGDAKSQPIAVCTVSYLQALRTQGRYAIIQEMFVDPPHRSGGAGMQVLQYALAQAAAHGCRAVELGTPARGERQIAFYRRAGFTEVGARLRWRAP